MVLPESTLLICVRAAAQRGFVAAAVGEVAGFPPVFGEDRQGGDIQRQGAVFIAGKVKPDLALAFDFDVFDVGEQGTKAQAALGHQQIEAVAHVLGGNRLAVGKTCLGVEVEAQRQTVVGALHLFSHQAVDRVGLIQGALGQGGIQPAVDLGNADAFVDIGQHMVKAPDFDRRAAQAATLGRVRVGIVEMAETGGVLGRFAVYGEVGLRGRDHSGAGQQQSQGGTEQR